MSVALKFCLDLAIFGLVACYFCLYFAIFAPVPRYFRRDIAISVPVACHFRLTLRFLRPSVDGCTIGDFVDFSYVCITGVLGGSFYFEEPVLNKNLKKKLTLLRIFHVM